MKMKCQVVAILISLAFVSQAFAVLRPLFPVKPGAPFNGDVIIIGDGLVPDSAKKRPPHHRNQARQPVPGQSAIALTNAGPSVGYVSAKISTRARSGME
jgi:hypothetical protein